MFSPLKATLDVVQPECRALCLIITQRVGNLGTVLACLGRWRVCKAISYKSTQRTLNCSSLELMATSGLPDSLHDFQCNGRDSRIASGSLVDNAIAAEPQILYLSYLSVHFHNRMLASRVIVWSHSNRILAHRHLINKL